MSLTKTLDEYVRDKVSSGEYESASEVIRESLRKSRILEEKERRYWAEVNAKVAVARKEIAEGKGLDGPAVMDEIIAELSNEILPKKAKSRAR